MKDHVDDTISFFSNKMKPERERAVCRAFLRTIGVSFKDCELIAPTEEPADVSFRSSRFQIREMLDPNRRRGDEWKNKEKIYSEANSLSELLEPYCPATVFNLNELVPEIVEALSGKAQRYGNGCNDIDALVYINLKGRYLAANSELPNIDTLYSQGWRSVSFLFSPYGVILFAKPEAPDFLTALQPGQYMKWTDIDSLFEKL